jgi:hypothetical protein
LNKRATTPSSVYLECASNFYDQARIDKELKAYINETIINIDVLQPDYTMTLSVRKKECIVVYSIIQKMLEESEK